MIGDRNLRFLLLRFFLPCGKGFLRNRTNSTNKTNQIPGRIALQNSLDIANILLPTKSRKSTTPIWPVAKGDDLSKLSDLTPANRTWLKTQDWKPESGRLITLPDDKGSVGCVLLGVDESTKETATGFIPGLDATKLPAGDYHLAGSLSESDSAALTWILGSYAFQNYKSNPVNKVRRLKLGKSHNEDYIRAAAKYICLGRDLINTPANDCGPEDLEKAVRGLASEYKAKVSVVSGDNLLKNNYPLIHAVGRASDRQPRFIELTWGDKGPMVVLVGKGICFDTGGLNIKPGQSMTLMKKDMGGSATAIALAGMIMALKLKVRLKLMVAAADNNISANAFRPGDVLPSRNGMTVEILNTDAEGRLVLADALARANEDKPDYVFTFATLTGAARVAMGPDVPPFFSNDSELAADLQGQGGLVGDPVWQLPFWEPYYRNLKSKIADISHLGSGGMAGSIVAGLFLKKFIPDARSYTHFDIYGWTPQARPGKPFGGEVQSALTVYSVLNSRFG